MKKITLTEFNAGVDSSGVPLDAGDYLVSTGRADLILNFIPLALQQQQLSSIDELKFIKNEQLKHFHDTKIALIKSKYSQSEIDSFMDKRSEAMAWRSDSTAKTPYVDAMTSGDTTARVALLNAILAKVDASAQLEAQVLALRDAIEAAITKEDLDVIVW